MLCFAGKSGPLFNFDVKDDIRIKSDAAVEKNESHAGERPFVILLCLKSKHSAIDVI